MYQGIQCPKCLRHGHEHFYAEQAGKKWSVDRCANCHHNFDIDAYQGSALFFYNRIKWQKANAVEP